MKNLISLEIVLICLPLHKVNYYRSHDQSLNHNYPGTSHNTLGFLCQMVEAKQVKLVTLYFLCFLNMYHGVGKSLFELLSK